MPRHYLCIPAIACLSLSLAACAITSSDGRRISPGSDAFADYVETVFRRQNELAGELSFALDDLAENSDAYLLLEEAELDLFAACRELNQLALRQREGESNRGPGALRRARQAPECERAVDAIATLLK